MKVQVKLLGPVEIIGPHGVAPLPVGRPRALAAVLALHADRPIPPQRLITALWGDEEPPTAMRTLQSNLARVRRALVGVACVPDILRRDEAGYRLRLDTSRVDSWQFEEHVGVARRAMAGGEVTTAMARLEQALGLWRGDALQGAEVESWAAAEVKRLHGLRLGAQDDLSEIRLRLGDTLTAAADLERLFGANPCRERTTVLLMLANSGWVA